MSDIEGLLGEATHCAWMAQEDNDDWTGGILHDLIAEVGRLRSVVTAIEALHTQTGQWMTRMGDDGAQVRSCRCGFMWPCPTVRVIQGDNQ